MNTTMTLIIRIIEAFLTLYIIVRIQGKRQIGQFTSIDYVVGLALGTIAGAWAYNLKLPAYYFFIAMLGFGTLGYMANYISVRNNKVQKALVGEPDKVIENGKINEENLRKNNFSVDVLMQKLRAKNVFNVADVEFAVIEPEGSISVLKKSQARPVTPKDLKIPTEYEGLSTKLIYDGHLLDKNLQQVNLNEQWLSEQLKSRHINSLADVMLASIDTQGNLYIDLKDDEFANDHKIEITD